MSTPYPRLICDLSALAGNVRAVAERCHAAGVTLAGVVKGVNGPLPINRLFAENGCDQIASSRLSQLRRCQGLGKPTMLIRVPMPSELEEVAELCDYSLHSDLSVLRRLDELCRQMGKRHKVVLMMDLGDLREGWWEESELLEAALTVERELDSLELAGIGTNLGCYGAVVPDETNMGRLIDMAKRIEAAIGRKLEIVSGGATTTFRMLHLGTLPKGINHLRIGEAILVNYDLNYAWGIPDMDYLSTHAFTLEAQVLECRPKPTHPVGTCFVDCLGNHPRYTDRGIRRRALIGVGKLDMGSVARLIPLDPGVSYVGGSSDHTILDVEDSPRDWHAGDVMRFDISYSELMYLTTAENVTLVFQKSPALL